MRKTLVPSAILESALYVEDIDRAETFYATILGLELLGKVEGRHAFFRCGNGVLLLFNAAATEVPPAPDAKLQVPPHGTRGQGHLCFSATAEELAAWEEHLTQKGIAIEGRVEWPAGGRSIYLRDPDGNSLEFAEPRIWGL